MTSRPTRNDPWCVTYANPTQIHNLSSSFHANAFYVVSNMLRCIRSIGLFLGKTSSYERPGHCFFLSWDLFAGSLWFLPIIGIVFVQL